MIRMLKDKEFRPLYIMILVLVACIFLTMALVGCKTKYIASEPVIVHERDSIVRVNTIQVHDTLHTRDSVYHYVKGDTTIIEKWHQIEKINIINRTDTIVQVQEKEIPVPYPQPYPVEKELSFWQRTRMKAGSLFIILLGGLLSVGGWKLYKRFKRR